MIVTVVKAYTTRTCSGTKQALFVPSHNIDMVAIKNAQNLIMQLVFIIKQINPEKCAENVYLAYVRKENLLKFYLIFIFIQSHEFFFQGNVWGQSQQYMSYFDNDTIFTRRQSLVQMIYLFHLAPKLLQNCLFMKLWVIK